MRLRRLSVALSRLTTAALRHHQMRMEGNRGAEGTSKNTSPMLMAAVKRPYDESLTPTGVPLSGSSKGGDRWLSKNSKAMKATTPTGFGGSAVHAASSKKEEDSSPEIVFEGRDENIDPTPSGRRTATRKRYELREWIP